jgi:hypothetical protein
MFMVAVIFRTVAAVVSGVNVRLIIVAAAGGLNPVVIEDNAIRIRDAQLVAVIMNAALTIVEILAEALAGLVLILNGRIVVTAIVFQPLAIRQFLCHNFCN